jgi:hypothetical protein
MALAAEVTMFGYVLVMIACIGISNTECQKFEFSTHRSTSLGCIAASQRLLTSWSVDHPQWTPRGSHHGVEQLVRIDRCRCA